MISPGVYYTMRSFYVLHTGYERYVARHRVLQEFIYKSDSPCAHTSRCENIHVSKNKHSILMDIFSSILRAAFMSVHVKITVRKQLLVFQNAD